MTCPEPRLARNRRPAVRSPGMGRPWAPSATCGGHAYCADARARHDHDAPAPKRRATSAGALERVCPLPAFDALVRVGRDLGWPRSFPRDLATHDHTLVQYVEPDEPFAWIIREDGTHLWRASVQGRGSYGPETAASLVRSTARAFAGYECRFYVWDPAMQQLRWCNDADEAATLIDRLTARWLKGRAS